MDKHSIKRCELKKIKRIRAKASMKHESSSSSSSTNDYDYYLSNEIKWYEIIKTAGRKEINIIDHVVNSNIKIKNKRDYDIEYEPQFDIYFIFLVGLRTPCD